MLDMIKPANRDCITLGDLKRCKMTHVFFDTFFNLEKYLDHEQRDPFASQRDEYVSFIGITYVLLESNWQLSLFYRPLIGIALRHRNTSCSYPRKTIERRQKIFINLQIFIQIYTLRNENETEKQTKRRNYN